ncbi:MAG: dihydrofolate reductase [Rhodoferax sp.]|nr:dihydrofolate reductase [Rhodoferax sp.]MCF8208570.1 dihydrofolate reductase [Rhodoferax sp.]
MRLHLIMARAANGVIGKNNALPWHLPEDMAHFKRLTLGCPVLMGRKTWDSLPVRFRPLPGRTNIVVSRQAQWSAAGALHARDLPQALELCATASDAWVIGGAELYAQALPLADSAEITEIDQAFEGDAFAPILGPQWIEAQRECHTSSAGLAYCFVRYINHHH